jgi:alanyl-tRNA synthetase
LREVLGEHVAQQGSAVDSLRLRFDFSHGQAVTPEQLRAVEQRVNRAIRANIATQTEVMDMESAKQRGAVALFGEKYGDEVRVLSIAGEFSVELCGGTHVERSGDIGLFRISAETSVASGVRRIEAVTGSRAEALCDDNQDLLRQLAAQTGSDRSRLAEKVAKLVADVKQQQKELAQLKAQLAGGAGVKLLAAVVPGADSKSLREVADKVRDKIGSGLFVLAAAEQGRAALVAGVTKDLTDRFKAGDLLKQVTAVTGGKGGGRPDMAQGAAEQADQLDAGFAALKQWLASQ